MTETLRIVGLLVRKEIVEARRNRWFLLFASAFAILSFTLSWLGLAGLSRYGLSGFGRTAASMVNLVMITVPLMGLTLGATSLAGERERGTLLLLASQPLSRFEILAGKFAGLAAALLGALLIGFGASGVLIAYYGGTTSVTAYLSLTVFAFLLATVSLSIGLFIAGVARRPDVALGVALFAWFAFVVVGDLGIIGTDVVARLGIRQIFVVSLFNPLQVFKVAAILALRGNLDALGPVGTFAARTYGTALVPLLVSVLVAWTAAGFALTHAAFKRAGAV